MFAFAPSAGAVLVDWGADVIKVEHPESGDPIRALETYGIKPGDGGVTFMAEILNHGKRSVGIDIKSPGGLEAIGTPLQAPAALPAPPAPPTVGRWQRGDILRWAQRHLGLKRTGRWDKPTRKAIRSFQRAHGLPVTGLLDPPTWASLTSEA